MPYPEALIQPMREELAAHGFVEARKPEDVDEAVLAPGTTMVVVNSVCGCAAGKARPGAVQALRHSCLPDRAITVFAGADIEATSHARTYFKGYLPSSPSIALMKDGEVVFMLERHQIENREASDIAKLLTEAFDRFCGRDAEKVS